MQIRDFFPVFTSINLRLRECDTHSKIVRQPAAMSHTSFLPIVHLRWTLFMCSSLWLKLWFICGLRYLNATVQAKYDKHLRSSHILIECRTCGLQPQTFQPAGCHTWLPHSLLLNIIYPTWSINIFPLLLLFMHVKWQTLSSNFEWPTKRASNIMDIN